ncbi:unnamed protein product [Allacma fusca]|uniref:Uncharacterized protein n=1 Tax=Allacma fusca TaxID=39272 RepID=A0A8J2J8H6_9HEXA|nr:unnamed protein product [Allacma fusca]
MKPSGPTTRFLQGADYPVAVFLLRHEKKTVLEKIKLLNDGSGFRSLKVDTRLENTIIRNTQDYYLVGSKTPFMFCEYFKKFYFGYDPSILQSPLLRDWGTNVSGKSLSRCAGKTEEIYSLPMQPSIMKYTTPSPGTSNDCSNTFTLPDNYNKRAKVASNGCYSFYATPQQRAIFFRNPNSFQMNLNLAELNDIQNATVIQSERGDQDEFEYRLRAESPHQWVDCSRYPQDQLESIQNLPHSPISIDVVLSPGTCSWLEYMLDTKTFRCRHCTALVNQAIIVDRPGSKYLAGLIGKGAGWTNVLTNKQAYSARAYNKNIIEDHKNSVIHIIAEDYLRLIDEGKTGEALRAEFERPDGPFRTFIKATENLIISVIYSVHMNLSFRSFKILGNMLHFLNVDTGFLYNTETAMGVISRSISKSLHNDFVNRLRKRPRELSIILDGSTDCAGYSTIAVLFQTYGIDNQISVFLYRVMEVKTSESGENIFNLFISYVEEDGIEDVIREQTVALATDGASNVKNTFRELLNQYTDNELVAVWCHCHRLEIVATRAYKKFDYLVFVDKFINRLCTFMTKKSGKRNLVFREVIEEFGFNRFELKRIRTMRWLSHRYRAIVPIITRYEVLIETFTRISVDTSYRAHVREEARYLLEKLKDPTLLSTICFTADAVDELAKYSGLLQKKGNTLIGTFSMRQDMRAFISSLLHTPGKNMQYLLNNSAVVSDYSEELEDVDFEDFQEHKIHFKNIELNEPDCNVTNVCIKNLTGSYISALMNELDAYFPPSVVDLYDVFLPTNIPVVHEEIPEYAGEEIQELNVRLQWGFNISELLHQWHNLIESIVYHDSFDEKVNCPPEIFWNYFLSADNVLWTTNTRSVVNRVLTTPPTSSSPESIFSMYSFIKDRKRYSLLPDSVESLIRIRYNGYKDIKLYNTVSIVRDFLSSHSRSDDTTRKGSSTSASELQSNTLNCVTHDDVDETDDALEAFDEQFSMYEEDLLNEEFQSHEIESEDEDDSSIESTDIDTDESPPDSFFEDENSEEI